jgi:plastocyanin
MAAIRNAALAALTFLLASPAKPQPAEFVIRVWNFGFAPHPIHLAAGRPVTLTFVNQSGSGHDFTAPGFFQHARMINGDPGGDEVELKAHETKTVTLVPRAGTYEAHCSHFLHKQMGMSDLITVD